MTGYSKKIRCITDDITFDSISKCSQYYGVDVKWLSDRTKKRMPCLGKRFEILEDKNREGLPFMYYYQGTTLGRWCKANGYSYQRVHKFIKKGHTIEEALKLSQDVVDRKKEKLKTHKCYMCEKRNCEGCPYLKLKGENE